MSDLSYCVGVKITVTDLLYSFKSILGNVYASGFIQY